MVIMVSLPANDRIDDGIVFYFEKLEELDYKNHCDLSDSYRNSCFEQCFWNVLRYKLS
ncbi:hypothetical protein F240042I4_64010 [Eisenbergiella tayi]